MIFEEGKPLNEAQFRAIRAMGNSQPGGYLSDYIKQEVEGYVNGMLKMPVTDVAQMAYAQAGAEFGQKVWRLLNDEIGNILNEHNIEPEEDDEA